MFNISTGHYTIRSLAQNEEESVGRFPIEDLSLLPKRVVYLGANFPPPQWIIIKDNDKCIFRANGANTHNMDGKVWAEPIDADIPTTWVLIAHPSQGPDVYSIVEAAHPSVGWVLSRPSEDEGLNPQILCKTLSGNNAQEELWVVKSLSED